MVADLRRRFRPDQAPRRARGRQARATADSGTLWWVETASIRFTLAKIPPMAHGGLPEITGDIALEIRWNLCTYPLSAGPASDEQMEEQWLTY